MKTQELPRFLREKARLKPRKSRAKAAPRFAGDTGTPEIKKRLQVAIENRGYSSTGHPTIVGARVEAQFPHDRYKIRNQLDPANEWRNLMLWPGAERIRTDFHASGLGPRMCTSFEPRVSSGNTQWEGETQLEALKHYKKAMNAVGASLRPVLFCVIIAGESPGDWAARNGMIPQAGIAVLRLGLAELAQ